MNNSFLKDFILPRMPGIAGLAAAPTFEIITFVFDQIESTKKCRCFHFGGHKICK